MNATIGQPARNLSTRESELKIKLEQDIRENLEGFKKVGAALTIIRDERLYREDYDTFEEYLLHEWDMGKSRAYQFIDAVEVIGNLSTIVDKNDDPSIFFYPANEAQVRPLVILPAENQRIVWTMVVEHSQSEDIRITARLIQQFVSSFLNNNVAKALDKAKSINHRKENGIPKPVQLTFQSFLEVVQQEADSNWSEVGKKNMAKMLRELLESIEA